MAILVTGGAGFIGSHLVERLLAAGQQIVVIDDFNDYYSPEIKRENINRVSANPDFKLIEGNICDRNCLNEIFRQHEISQVIHLAARAGVRASLAEPQLYNEVNVLGTINLLECCKEHNITKFIFGSSSSVYGTTTNIPFTEDDLSLQPISPYALTKVAGEQLCRVYHKAYGIAIICLRFFTVYGPRQRPEMAIHKFSRLISEEQPIPFYGDGASARDYTYIDDIVDGLVAALDCRVDFEVINLGDSRTITLKELVAKIEKSLGKKARLNKMPMQPGDVPITYAAIDKAKKLLGYQPKVEIEEGLKKFISWYNNC